MYGKSCKYCAKAIPISLTSDILCKEKGVVSDGYLCSKYKPSPSIKTPKELNYKCIDCKSFSQSISLSAIDSSVGTCIIFCTRPFDGNKRSACKRFELRTIREVI